MNPLVIKILAVGLTVAQVFTLPPEKFQGQFDPATDQANATALLHSGCDFISKQFGADNIDFGDLLDLAAANAKALKAKADQAAKSGQADDPDAPKSLTSKLIAQLDFDALDAGYKQFCKGETVANSPIKLDEVIAFYNNAMKDLPDHSKLKGMHLPEASTLLDGDGNRFSEIYADNGRRHWISIHELPDYVKQAFVSAEDQNFYQHHGIDIHGILRAFYSSMMGKGRPQGGSTITQQVVKNLLTGDDLTFERKMREMVLATRVEKLLSKDEILELYLNYVFMGRASWGIEMGANSYFGKSAKQLTHAEAALLAGLVKGPNYYHPDRFPDRALERRQYVIDRMKEDGYLKDSEAAAASKEPIKTIPFESPSARAAFYYIDEIQRDAKRKAGITSLTGGSYVIRSTIHTELQKTAEAALQDGLAAYETATGRAQFTGPVGNMSNELEKYSTSWKELLPRIHSPLYDVRWPLAVVLGVASKGNPPRVGLADGRVAYLVSSPHNLAKLKVYDLVHVKLDESKKYLNAILQIPPVVQGAVVAMEAKTGRVLAMAGGFSYAQSQLNRVTQTARQPGSTMKPFVYLAAMNLGYQPNTLLPDAPISLPPIEHGGHWWTPHNFEAGSRGLVTARQAVERSLNMPTARMMAGMANTPTAGLDYIRGIAHEIGIYQNPVRVYPFVLGAQPARLLDMAAAYATIANIAAPYERDCPLCLKPVPHFFDSIEQNNKLIYQRPRFGLLRLNTVDRTSVFQIRHILEGTVARGTAYALKDLSGYIGAKTGTSNNENDAWFVGFTNDLVVAVWVGYDSRKIESTLGSRFTGARVALPIAETVLRKSFDIYKPKELLAGLPADLNGVAALLPMDLYSGALNGGDFLEAFRLGPNRQPLDTRNQILRSSEYAMNMNMSEAPGEEDDPEDVPNLADGDYPGPDREIIGNDPGYTAYQPGADDIYDLWQQHDRQVDPMYYQPPIFRPNN